MLFPGYSTLPVMKHHGWRMLIVRGFNFPSLNRTNDQNHLPDSERAGTVCAKQIWHLHRLRSSTDNPPVRQQAYQLRLYWPGASAGYIAPCLCKIITWKWLREEFLGSLNQIISEHLSIVLHFKAVTSYPVALEEPKGAPTSPTALPSVCLISFDPFWMCLF